MSWRRSTENKLFPMTEPTEEIPTIATIPSLTARKERDGMGVKKSEYRNEEKLLLRQQMYFDRCVDFLALMIEKYGGEIELPLPEATNPQADRVVADAA